MLVYGISSSPTGGYVSLDGIYVPTRGVSNYGNAFGYRDSGICTSMCVSKFNMPNEQIKVDSATGISTWSIVPKRLDSSSTVRLEKVLVGSSNADIGITTIVPVVQQNNGQLVELNSISGQANSPITDFPTDDNIDIFFVSVTMFPSYPDANQVDPLSSASCRQSQSLTMASSSSNVNAQGNIWQINIDQTYGLSVKVDTLRVNTEEQRITGIVLLMLIDANQQQIGPFVSQINDGSILTIQNLPSTSISTIHLQFPDGTESSGYSVDMVLCPQTTAASSKSCNQGYNSQSGQSIQQNSLLQPHQLKPYHHRYQMLPVSQVRQPSQLVPVNQQGHSRKLPYLGQVSQQQTPWLYPQPAPLNQLDKSWQSPYSGQAGQQQTPRQPNQTAKPGSPLGKIYDSSSFRDFPTTLR
ncbi:unnamed protein product [Rotaria socialis]|uniref:Uncharacterized protein n=1 Tax=Rotaria socialis TaxID=392032 RepID=A0A817SCC3_9BILA|nr:unnamed protein product [Rotaria socialis]